MDVRLPILAGGAVAAAAAAAAAWRFAAVTEAALPAGVGLAVLALVGVAAEMAARGAETTTLRREIKALKQAQAGFQTEVAMARDGMLAVHQALQDGGGSRQRLAAMEDEVAVLQKLVARLQAGGAPAPKRQTTAKSAAKLDEARVLELVRAAVAEGAVDLYVQPVVSLPQRHRRYYECFSRIPDQQGGLLAADAYLAAAEDAGLIAPIDNLLLFRAVQIVRRTLHQNADIGFFCNLSRHTLRDVGFLEDFTEFLKENVELAPRLILEIAQADWDPNDPEIARCVERMTDLGVRFSLDRVEDFALDGAELRRRGFRFVKATAAALLGEAGPSAKELRRALAADDIKLIVEKIERERELVELLEHDVDLGQGYLFGEPKAPTLAAAAA